MESIAGDFPVSSVPLAAREYTNLHAEHAPDSTCGKGRRVEPIGTEAKLAYSRYSTIL